eukprot:g504.t1
MEKNDNIGAPTNSNLFNKTEFLQKLYEVLELDKTSNESYVINEVSIDNKKIVNQIKKMPISKLNLKCNEALNDARRLARYTGTARPIFHAILNEYERWLYSLPSDYENLVNKFQAKGTTIRQNIKGGISDFSMLPPSFRRRNTQRKDVNSRHEKLVKRVERESNTRHNDSLIPKKDYIVLSHAVAPEDNDKYPAIYNPSEKAFEQLVFPSKYPYGKRDSKYLKEWLDANINRFQSQTITNYKKKNSIGNVENELTHIIPTVNIALNEIVRQFHPNNRKEINFVVSLWQMILKVMSIMMSYIKNSKDEHVEIMKEQRNEITRLDKLIESATAQLTDAIECTNNIKNDTNVLERALASKEKELDRLIIKHHKTAKHLRKVLKLVQKMEDEEFLHAYKEGKRMERIDGLSHVMDKLSDVLVNHDEEIQKERERIRFNSEDFDDQDIYDGDQEPDSSVNEIVEQHSKHATLVWNRINTSVHDDDEDSVDEEFGVLDEMSSFSLTGESSTLNEKDFNGVANDDIKVTPEVYENLAILRAEVAFLKTTLKEKMPINIYYPTCHRETQTDELDIENGAAIYTANQTAVNISNNGKTDTMSKAKQKASMENKSKKLGIFDKIPTVIHPYANFLPENYVPAELSFKVTKMHVERIYNQYIKYYERNTKSKQRFNYSDVVSDASPSPALIQFAYDLYLGVEEIIDIAQSKLCNICMSVVKYSESDMGCHMFARLCRLIPDIALPNESITVFFAALSYLKHDWRSINGSKYVKLKKGQETVGLLCNTSLSITNAGLKNLAVLMGIDGGVDRVEYLAFDTFMQYVVTMWEKDYNARKKSITASFVKHFSNDALVTISSKEFSYFITDVCDDKQYSQETLYLMYDYIHTKTNLRNKTEETNITAIEDGSSLDSENKRVALSKSILIDHCLKCGLLEPDYKDIILSMNKKNILENSKNMRTSSSSKSVAMGHDKQNISKNDRINLDSNTGEDDELMFGQLIALWDVNKKDIEEFVFKTNKEDDERNKLMQDKYNELIDLLEAKLNGVKALELYTELLKSI